MKVTRDEQNQQQSLKEMEYITLISEVGDKGSPFGCEWTRLINGLQCPSGQFPRQDYDGSLYLICHSRCCPDW